MNKDPLTILSELNIGTVSMLKEKKRAQKGAFWCTCQVYFDENGNMLEVMPLMSEKKMFSMQVMRDGKLVPMGFRSQDMVKQIEDLIQQKAHDKVEYDWSDVCGSS